MKQYIKKNVISLIPILFSLLLFVYLTIVILKYPLIGLELKENSNQWVVERIIGSGWALRQPIEEGDILLFVNGEKPENHFTVTHFNRVELARSITIVDKSLNYKTFEISNEQFDKRYVFYLLLPFLFCATVILLSVFLYLKIKDDRSATILIYFLLSIGICYLGASVSVRGDIIGRISMMITLPSSLVLFAHFLKTYFIKYNLEFIKTRVLETLYVCNFIILVITVGNQLFSGAFDTRKFELLFFMLLLFYLLFYLFQFYSKHKTSVGSAVIKILGMAIFLAFSPFVFFYVIPTILYKTELIPAEITAVFLIIIPIALVYLQLTEKLFDIEFFLNRLRYYALISLPYTVLIVFLLSFPLNIKLSTGLTTLVFFILFISTTLFLYLKEYIDYKLRHHLFSQKNDFEASLYKFFQKAKYETKVDSFITNLMNEIQDVLVVKQVLFIEIVAKENGDKWGIKNKKDFTSSLVKDIENINWDHYQIGTLVEVMENFSIVIRGDRYHKSIILFGPKKFKTNLNIQERIWLETLAYVSSILLENFQLIEGLFKKIKEYKVKNETENNHQPFWLSRLLFSLSEKERMNLSIDLHDSVLQDQLQLLREVDKISGKVTDLRIKNDLSDLKERMLDNIHLIRDTCNELRPPFLSELGIIQSIQNLIDQTKLRCNFILKTELEQSIQRLDQEYELTLYRVVQELLNNAMKHSFASEVEIVLSKNSQIISLVYRDNGQGIDMSKLKNSFQTMGISGMKERVKSIGGTIKIDSAPEKGMEVLIELKKGDNRNV